MKEKYITIIYIDRCSYGNILIYMLTDRILRYPNENLNFDSQFITIGFNLYVYVSVCEVFQDPTVAIES